MGKTISILIIDDNRNFLKAISEFIQEQHICLIRVLDTAENGGDGIRLAREHKPNVILLDLKMPDLDGFMLIPLLREALPEVKIIATTLLSSEIFEQSGDIYRSESMKAGADAFIPKYKLENELAAEVCKLIHPKRRNGKKIFEKTHCAKKGEINNGELFIA